MNNIIDVYLLYGFELAEETKDYLVFTYTNGYFSNAEIVKLNDKDCTKCKEKYESLSYSVTIISYSDVEKLHKKLFAGFFSVSQSKIKNAKEYANYCEKQKQKFLISKYEYLNCDYAIDESIYENGLVDYIYSKLSETGPQLIILEAAAGYGKTCTSFEVLQRFSACDEIRVPLMTELSKNRKASIFKYVLLSEIDSKFPALSTKVVNFEIKNGNVPLIIDGFDELLSKSIEYENDDESSSEEAQNMLDTIAQLFKDDSQAKILITSRKSAIFTGEQFDEWSERRQLSGLITRIELKSPRVKNWIGVEKEQILKEKSINLDYISNPILLSILRDKDKDYLRANDIAKIIEEYFSTIMDREKERQSLSLEKDEQSCILRRLASSFADMGISSDSMEFVKEILFEITKEDLEEFISRYKYSFDSIETLPDDDQFVGKLLHHALLDRVAYRKNQIGFINDFVFGYFLGQAILNGDNDLVEACWDYKYIDLISTSYAIDGIAGRGEIQEKVHNCIDLYSVRQQLEISNKLFHRNVRGYNDQTITDFDFSSGFIFDPNNTISDCVFVNCIFDTCCFSDNSLSNCQFYNCTFYNPIVRSDSKTDYSLSFIACVGHEELESAYCVNSEIEHSQDEDYERVVLEQFWKRGSDAPERRRAFRTMYRGFTNTQSRMVDDAIHSLLQKNLLIKKNYCYELNFTKLEEIKQILGRE